MMKKFLSKLLFFYLIICPVFSFGKALSDKSSDSNFVGRNAKPISKATSKNIAYKFYNKKISNTKENPIIIKGNQRIDDQTIKSFLDPTLEITNDKTAINNSIKRLYETELFSEVKIYPQDKTIIVEVQENPIIGEVSFEGNKKIDSEVLASEMNLKKRAIYTKSKLQTDIKRINDIYIKSGRFLSKIDPQIIKKEQNRVDLIFKIYEGKKAKIAEIYFVGNQAFTDKELNDQITTKKSKWYKFLTSSDSYDSDRIEFDREMLRRLYTSKGYADFMVISAVSEIAPTKDKFFITFLLEEGIKYNLGEINIVNYVKKFDEKLLNKAILTKKGQIYNGDLVDKTIDKMIDIMSERGYAFADIEPVLKRDKENKIIAIDYVLRETPRVYINQINISGNTRTIDEVIRRELRVSDGDPYNITKIRRSKQRIQNLGFFDKVEFNTKRIANSDKVDLDIEVQERKTGELNFGIGYSTVDRATGNIGLRERNLFGTGRELGLNVQKSSTRFSSEINYTKPYFLDRQISVGFDLFNYKLDKRNTLVYDQKTNGIVLRGDYSISEYLGHQVRYSFRDETIDNVDPGASISLRNLQGSFTSSAIGHSLLFDKRDNRLDPRDGYYLSLSQDWAGAGGNLHYLRNEGSAGYYIPTFNNDFVLKFSGRFGYIEGIGQDIRSNNNFFLGGNNFRGFEYAGLGPRTKINGSFKGGDSIGGKMYYVATTEFRFPLGLPKEMGISGVLFNDLGTVKMVDEINKRNSEVIDTGSLRSSYGLSIVWSSPLGPIRLDFSKIAKKEWFDNTENFRFSFGTTF